MKSLITFAFAFMLIAASGQEIKVNIGLDTLTNTRMKAESPNFSFDGRGNLIHVTYLVKKYQLNNTTPVSETGSETRRQLLSAREYRFEVGGKWINTSTKAILSDTTGITPKARLDNYLRTKAVNSFPGVAGNDPLSKLLEGLFKEIIAIKQASKELP